MDNDESTVIEESSPSDQNAEPTFDTVEMPDMTEAEHASWLKSGKLPERFMPKEQKDKKGKPDSEAIAAAKAKEKAEADAKAKKEGKASKSAAQAETETASETDDTNDQDSGNKDDKKPKGAEKRKLQLSEEIADLLKQRKEAESALAEVRRQKAETENGPAPAAKPAKEETKAADGKLERPKKPLQRDFDTWDDYETARDKYFEDVLAIERQELTKAQERLVREAIEADRKDREKVQTQAQIQEANKKIEDSWKKRLVETQRRHPDDFDAVFSVKVNATADQYLLKIPEGAEVLYYLGTHKEEAEEIFGLDAYETMERLVPLRSQIIEDLKPKEKKPVIPRSTKPPHDVGGKNAAPSDELDGALDRDDFATYQREGNRREVAKKQSGKFR